MLAAYRNFSVRRASKASSPAPLTVCSVNSMVAGSICYHTCVRLKRKHDAMQALLKGCIQADEHQRLGMNVRAAVSSDIAC